MGKYYVVFEGRQPGVYSSWDDCLMEVEHFPGARFKGYSSQLEAVNAYRKYSGDDGLLITIGKHLQQEQEEKELIKPAGMPLQPRLFDEKIILDSLAVDAACSGNPGVMEYRGVYVRTAQEVFHVGPYRYGTNNIGEFLAIVHALALLKRKGSTMPIYSDSLTAQKWVRIKQCRTTLTAVNPDAAALLDIVHRAEKWLSQNTYDNVINKWDTEAWGEIPADFGRK